MELKLEQEYMNGYVPVLETQLTQEETLEAIVPDAYPDILNVVDCGGQVILTGKDVQDGEVSVSGKVLGWMLYRPEDGQGIHRMELTIPFISRATAAGVEARCRCVAQPRLRAMDVRALNPRKVLARVDLAVDMEVYDAVNSAVCSGVLGQEEDGLEQRVGEYTIYTTPAVQEKEFSIYDELRLSVNADRPPEILCVQASPVCTESRIIGNKFVFKGEVRVQLRMLCDGHLCSHNSVVTFSQIMELADVGEGADGQVELCMTGLELSPSQEDDRVLSVSMDILAQAVVHEQRRLSVLEDAYSTVTQLQLQRESVKAEQLAERTVRTQNLRQLLELPDMVNTVVDAQAELVGVQVNHRDGAFETEGQVRVKVLYLDSEELPRCVSRVLSTSVRVDAPTGTQCRCRCMCPGEVFANPAAGGVEVRLSLPFHILLTATSAIPVITQLQPGSERERRTGDRPSMVLRAAVPGESLWDIAKAYSTTCERIRKANAMDTDELPLGQMLLIPGAC